MTFELEKTTPGGPPAAPRHLTLGGLNYSYNSHASTPIAENWTSRPPSWTDFAKLQLKYPKEMSVIY